MIAEAEKNKKTTNGRSNSEPRSARLLSLSDILYRSEGNSDASQDDPRSGRESDYDEELELDFDTSLPEDEEGHDVESNVFLGSLNLRIHSRADSNMETGYANGSCESPTSSCENDKAPYEVVTNGFLIVVIVAVIIIIY